MYLFLCLCTMTFSDSGKELTLAPKKRERVWRDLIAHLEGFVGVRFEFKCSCKFAQSIVARDGEAKTNFWGHKLGNTKPQKFRTFPALSLTKETEAQGCQSESLRQANFPATGIPWDPSAFRYVKEVRLRTHVRPLLFF